MKTEAETSLQAARSAYRQVQATQRKLDEDRAALRAAIEDARRHHSLEVLGQALGITKQGVRHYSLD